MIKRITLTEDHIKLLKLVRYEEGENGNILIIDKNDPYILSGRIEDLALALGFYDKMIPGTENDAEGGAFPDEIEEYLVGVHEYIRDNILDIELLIHQLAFSGGITPGTYKCIDTEGIWEKES